MEQKIVKFEENNVGIIFTQLEKEILLHKEDKQIKDIETNILIKKIKELISGAYFNAGYQIKGENEIEKTNQLILLSQSFVREIIDLYPTLNLKDIEIAFRRGTIKEYGEYMGISVVTMINWIKCYRTEKQEAIFKNNKIKDKLLLKDNEKSKEEIEKLMKEGCFKAFNIYQKTGYFNDFGNAIYNFLDEKYMLGYTPDEKKAYMELAIDKLKKINDPLNAKNEQKRSDMIKFIKSLNNNPQEKEKEIISIAKELALNDYFKTIENIEFYD